MFVSTGRPGCKNDNDKFKCKNGIFINCRFRCDGYVGTPEDCSDFSDEMGCDAQGTFYSLIYLL